MALSIKSKKGAKPSANDQEQQRKPESLSQYWIAAGALASFATAAAFVGALMLSLGHERAAEQSHLQALVTSLADGVGHREERLREQLTEMAAETRLRTAFEYADQANFEVEAKLLRQRIPVAVSLDLVRIEHASSGTRILDESKLTLSYAGLDLVKQVMSSGATSRMEAHQVSTAQAHLAIAAPVLGSDGKTILGVLHLGLPLSILPTPNPEIARDRRFLFRQGSGNAMATITPQSAPNPDPGAITASAPIPQSGIELFVWQPAPTLLGSALLLPFAGVFAILIIIQSMIIAGVGATQLRRLRSEIDQLNAGLGQSNLGQLQSKRSIRLRELLALDEGLKYQARKRFSQAADSGVHSQTQAETDASALATDLDLDLQHPDIPAEPMTTASTPPSTDVAQPAPRPEVARMLGNIPARVFRPYDIRGAVDGELTDDFMRLLGEAIGSESQDAKSRAVLVGRDYRDSGERLAKALTEGLRASGCDVIDLGVVPTPALYFASHLAGHISGAMVTASHEPARYNGVKLVLSGKSATALNIAKLKQRLSRGQFHGGEGSYREQSVLADYFDEIEQNITFARPLKLAIDCGFATPALVAPQLFRNLGCEVVEVRCDLHDPRAGSDIPNPEAPENLRDLIDAVTEHQADLGIGFDGDGDRLGIIDSAGQFIATDRVMMILAADLLSRMPGSEIVFDVQCSRLLRLHIEGLGGKPVMWKSGSAFIKEKREEVQSPLAADFSGHIVFADRWNGFDDAFYAAARLIEVLAIDPRPTSELFGELPVAISTPELLAPVEPGQELGIMAQILEMKGRLSGVHVITIDGLRVESDKGWGLVRASNNQPALAFRFEANNESTLNKLKDLFRRIMESAAPHLKLPF